MRTFQSFLPCSSGSADNEVFRRELALVSDVQGRAQGRANSGRIAQVGQGEGGDRPFELQGRYGRFIDPVRLSGESFRIDGPQITPRSLQ